MLKWRADGYKDGTPFGAQSKANRQKKRTGQSPDQENGKTAKFDESICKEQAEAEARAKTAKAEAAIAQAEAAKQTQSAAARGPKPFAQKQKQRRRKQRAAPPERAPITRTSKRFTVARVIRWSRHSVCSDRIKPGNGITPHGLRKHNVRSWA